MNVRVIDSVESVAGRDPFAATFGVGRGLGLPPRRARLRECDLSGYAQFVYDYSAITDESKRYAAGEEPHVYHVVERRKLTWAQWEEVHAHPLEQRSYLSDVKLGVGTTAASSVLRDVDDMREYSPAETALFWQYGYHEALELLAPDGQVLLVLDDYDISQFGLHVGWPCPNPQEDTRPWLDFAPFVGRYADGYTEEDLNEELPTLSQKLGLKLVCLWESYEDGCCSGHSQFFVVTERGLVDIPVNLWELLLEADAEFTRVNTATVGDIVRHEIGSYHQHNGVNYLPGKDCNEDDKEWTDYEDKYPEAFN